MEKLLTPKNFKCDRFCGECCKKLLVQVGKEEIKKIKNLGYKDFLFEDPFNKNRFFLKKNENGWCTFLEKNKEGKYSCTIHKNRPKICNKYPFFDKKPIKSCLPEVLYPNVFFSLNNK